MGFYFVVWKVQISDMSILNGVWPIYKGILTQ